jgi:FAD/FMN-containing dehydrogenase
MSGRHVASWGRHPALSPERTVALRDRDARLPGHLPPALPFGNGRSYGDSCRNAGGTLLLTRGLDRFIDFDAERGVLRCEAGVLFDDILRLVVPAAWFPPVTPGTRFVTMGGAIANDVHGKNHHVAGSFGRHLDCFELLRSDGTRQLCSPTQAPELFAATIGGLGLTGLITWAQFRLSRIPGPWLAVETLRFRSLDEFFALSGESNEWEHTVAWIDCLAPRGERGRGLFSRARPVAHDRTAAPVPRTRLRVPFTPPVPLLGGAGLRHFNRLWFHRPLRRHAVRHYAPFLYPLDGIGDWNRLYGPRGFVQHQCVIPPDVAQPVMAAMLDRIAADGAGSFLAVLKRFGDLPSPGLLSFPRPGTTLALDFPWRGGRTARLLAALDGMVAEAGGAVYPAKDAHMSGAHFRAFFPRWQAFSGFVDPGFSSSFWRRVTSGET